MAIKTIQLSSDITQHDEFIKATFSSEIFLKQTTYLLLEAKTPSYFITCVNYQAKNGKQAFFQIIFD